MANPYTTTVTFPAETLGTGDTWQLILTFSTALDGTNASEASTDRGLEIIDHGTTKWDYDMQNLYISQGMTEIQLADTQDFLSEGFLFGSDADDTVAAATDKRFIVEIKLNGATEFYGSCVEDSLQYDYREKTIKFTASPEYDTLKNTMLYDEDGNHLNPIGYADLTYYLSIDDIIKDIYETVNPTITTHINHDWLFGDISANIYDFEHIKLYLQDIYNNSGVVLASLADVLKHLAVAFFARTGIISSNKAIFEKIGYYDTGDTQALNAKSIQKEFRYPKVTWVKFISTDSGWPSLVENAYEMPSSDAYTTMEGRYINETVIPHAHFFELEIPPVSSNIKSEPGNNEICFVKDPIFYNTYTHMQQLEARCWYAFRSNLHSQIIYSFKCPGVGYVIDKTATYGGHYYQIVGMEKDWEKEVTTIECFRCA